MTRHVRLLSITLLLGFTAVFAQPTVVTSIHPLYALTQEIAGENAEVIRLLPPGVSPHTFDPSPRDVAQLEDADLLVMNGVLDEWLVEMAEAVNSDAPLFEFVEAVEFEPIEGGHDHDHGHGDEHGDDHDHDEDKEHGDDHDHDEDKEHGDEEHDEDEHGDEHSDEHDHDEHSEDHDEDKEHDEHGDEEHGDEHGDEEHGDEHGDEHGHGHDHGGVNPHLWLDPVLMAQAAPLIAEQLAELDPDNASAYLGNGERVAAELVALDAELRETLAPVAGAAFVPFHDAWPYFARAYNLDLIVEIEPAPGREPSPAYIAEALELIEGSGAEAVFSEVQLPPRPAEVVAESAELPLYILDPLGGGEGREGYADLLRYNANTLLEALAQE